MSKHIHIHVGRIRDDNLKQTWMVTNGKVNPGFTGYINGIKGKVIKAVALANGQTRVLVEHLPENTLSKEARKALFGK